MVAVKEGGVVGLLTRKVSEHWTGHPCWSPGSHASKTRYEHPVVWNIQHRFRHGVGGKSSIGNGGAHLRAGKLVGRGQRKHGEGHSLG